VNDERVLDLAPDADGARTAAQAARSMVEDADPEAAFACELSVAEACANVVEHSSSGRLRVVIRRADARFSVAVCDRGEPFRPGAAAGMPAPEARRGRGIALMAECMDRVRVVRVDGENRLLMSRRLRAPSGPVALEGRLDLRESTIVHRRVSAALAASGGSLVLDLGAVEFIDSSGLAVLADLHREAGRLGGRLAIVAPEGPARRIFALTRTDGFFTLAATREEALAAIAPPAAAD
jgi:anti-sigma B factor antagonist